MQTKYTITGHDAIRLAERDGLTLTCAANPIDDGGVVTVDKARNIAKEDASLISVMATPTGWTDDAAGANVSDYFRGAEYLGPDMHGLEPTWEDARA